MIASIFEQREFYGELSDPAILVEEFRHGGKPFRIAGGGEDQLYAVMVGGLDRELHGLVIAAIRAEIDRAASPAKG